VNPAAVKADFRSASVLKDGRVVINIAGNEYRLVVWVTHAAYEAIDAQKI
jgi:mRNA interferase HigB